MSCVKGHLQPAGTALAMSDFIFSLYSSRKWSRYRFLVFSLFVAVGVLFVGRNYFYAISKIILFKSTAKYFKSQKLDLKFHFYFKD